MTISIQEFLSNPEVGLVSPFGIYAHIFKTQNRINVDNKTHCAFTHRLNGQSVSFVYDLEAKAFSMLHIKDEKNEISKELTEQDKAFIAEVFDVFFERVGKDVARLTKTIRKDYGRDYKKEVLERHGFSEYIQNHTHALERSNRMNIFTHTLQTKDQKRASVFANR